MDKITAIVNEIMLSGDKDDIYCLNIQLEVLLEQLQMFKKTCDECKEMKKKYHCECDEEEVECYGCGDMPCVEPEDPLDVRLCKSCYEESERLRPSHNNKDSNKSK